MSRKPTTNNLLAALLLFLIASIMIGGAGAMEITIDIPTSAAAPNQIITIPVTLHDAENIVSFSAEVPNTIAGAVITINEYAPDMGISVVNSKPEQEIQKYVWISAEGLTAASTVMFQLEITITDETLTSVPVDVIITELATNSGILPIDSYSVSSPVTLSVGTGSGAALPTPSESQIPSESVVPTASPSDQQTAVPTETSSPGIPETVPTVPVLPVETTPVATPGFPAVSLLAVLGIAGVIIERRKP